MKRSDNMSAAPSPPGLRASLQALQCHFTWDLDTSKVHHLNDKLEDIGTEDGNPWLGHIYNLQAHVHFVLASAEDAAGSSTGDAAGSSMGDALRCFGMAAEAFRQLRNTVSDQGPWLLVNYSNLAWLHYHMGEPSKSLSYLGKVDALLGEYPSPVQGQPHQEVLAEKAWTLMNFSLDGRRKAVELFAQAIEMEPGMAEWTTSRALALASSFTDPSPEEEAGILEALKRATLADPANHYIAAVYLGRLAQAGGAVVGQARELAERVLRKPLQSTYSGISPLVRLYRLYVSLDEAIDVAKEALERHPTKRHLKRCLATCYKWKTFSDGDGLLVHGVRDRAIELHKELIGLYPHCSFAFKITLAELYPQHSNMEGVMVFQELLESKLDPDQLQILYNKYAKCLNYRLQDRHGSITYHMKAAEIPHPSKCRDNSIHILTKIKNRRMNRMCGEIEEFLAQLNQ